MSLCGAAHPERPELRCALSAAHPDGTQTHRDHGADYQRQWIMWKNEAWIDDPPPKSKRQPTMRQIAKSITTAETAAARDEAIQRVDDHADPNWKASATQALLWCIEHLNPFTADDVWDRMAFMGVARPHEPAALGPVIQEAARAGLIEKTGEMPLTRHSRRHRNITEWRPSARMSPPVPIALD